MDFNHFEEIWNAAESIDQQYPDEMIETKIRRIKSELDKIHTMTNFPSKQAEMIGEILFDICGITRVLNINSAAALKLAMQNRLLKLKQNV